MAPAKELVTRAQPVAEMHGAQSTEPRESTVRSMVKVSGGGGEHGHDAMMSTGSAERGALANAKASTRTLGWRGHGGAGGAVARRGRRRLGLRVGRRRTDGKGA